MLYQGLWTNEMRIHIKEIEKNAYIPITHPCSWNRINCHSTTNYSGKSWQLQKTSVMRRSSNFVPFMWWSWFIEQRRSPSGRSLQEEQEDGGAWCLLGSHSRKSRNAGYIRKSLAYCSFAFTHTNKLLNLIDWGLISDYGQFDTPEEWRVIRGIGHLKIN